MAKVRGFQEGRRGWAWWLAVAVVKPVLHATTRHHWIGADKVPAQGGCLIVANHISEIDPLIIAHLVWDHGRIPRYLAKAGLFRNRFFGFFLRAAGQIPVERASLNAICAYDAAVEAVQCGKCVIVYPEGTITRDPGLWPMTGKSGAARIALATGTTVIPMGQWGAQQLLAPYAAKPDLFPRKLVTVQVGEPVDLDDLRAQGPTAAAVDQATVRIIAAITELLEQVRHETAPAKRFDPRTEGVREFGNPNAEGRRS